MTDSQTTTAFLLGLFLTLLGLALSTTGCGGFTLNTAQEAVTAGAEVTEDIDNELAPLVSGAVSRCDAEHDDLAGFTDCMTPYLPLRWAVAILRAALFAGQSAIDAWAAGTGSAAAFVPIGACIVEGVSVIAGVVRLADLDVTLDDALGWADTVRGFAGGLCPPAVLETAGRPASEETP